MPVDKMLADPMLDTFRKMAKECQDKGYSGESFDNMTSALKRMEQLAQEHGDFNKFSAQMMQENLQLKFSQHYGEVLAGAAQESLSSKEGGYDDDNLMEMTLKAYEDAIPRLKQAQEEAFASAKGKGMDRLKAADKIIPLIQKIVELGKSGISFPKFLAKLVIDGLSEALNGQVALRDAILFEIQINKETSIPPIIKMHKERLTAFDELAKKSPFNLPDTFEFSLKSTEIEWKYAPVTAKWRAIQDGIEKLFTLLLDWLDSYCSFAPNDDRWRSPQNPEATKKNIRRTHGCSPGFLKERERIFFENFKIKWDDILNHTVFKFFHSALYFPYSEERFQLIKDTYQHCKPVGSPVKVEAPPKELINLAEKLYSEKRCQNPNLEKHKQKMIATYNKYWGEGAYEKAFGKD